MEWRDRPSCYMTVEQYSRGAFKRCVEGTYGTEGHTIDIWWGYFTYITVHCYT
jgi:hypothetical protein